MPTINMHRCPGQCGRKVPNHLFACRPCWYRLPLSLRQPITDNYRRDAIAHAEAMAEAQLWYLAQLDEHERPTFGEPEVTS